jgi:uncharacterized protein (DUF427 family)
MQAIWQDTVLAQSESTIALEGNQYFPPESVNQQYLRPSNTHTTCSWKGVASYYDVVVDGQVNKDAAWYYPAPKDAAQQIKGYIAFWKGVKSVGE